MENLWNEQEAAEWREQPLGLRVYSSRLLGQESALVLHGGGNTSVKAEAEDLFGQTREVLYVKGSGWDLVSIEAPGFSPVRLDALLKLAERETLGDAEMVRAQRAALLDPYAPNPSVEAILHAIIPFRYVDHTHADAVVTLSNTPDGEQRIRELYGDRVLVVPYVMPGFVLARTIYQMTRDLDWSRLEGMVLLHHGVFSFADQARLSYERMIKLVSEAEDYLRNQGANWSPEPIQPPAEDLPMLARIRREASRARGGAVVARWDCDPASLAFSALPGVEDIAIRGPLTPDHVIRTKRQPVILAGEPEAELQNYVENYRAYFERNQSGQVCLNPAPCWGVWRGRGTLAFAPRLKEAGIIADIKDHTLWAIATAERLGGWRALPERDIFEVEYWELEQAKLGKGGNPLSLQGKIALVSGAASGIGKACVQALRAQGAVVAALDLNPELPGMFPEAEVLTRVGDVTDGEVLAEAVATTVRAFGGLDILVSNAGNFPASARLGEMDRAAWDGSLAVNLTAHQQLLQACVPYLKLGVDPAVVMIASKNVPAPGPGAAAYSVAKAGQTQLARVAALELAESRVRVNVLHPDAVFDTGIWTEEVLNKRAAHYGLSVEAYKTRNLLRREVTSRDVAELACALAGPLFAKTTGAQIPVDGGNERVI